ncbi:MAG: 23S rRNA (uracil(1939)-C(5))-methyltransferase RlmD [Clostridiaceae bacterium]|nr:23S rRNA (uracil(1939)-C(5))-methyltransferase RlmD [Clostridiaceae bacterium]
MTGKVGHFICEIRDLNERGQGVGVVVQDGSASPPRQGMVCFVDGALPGEKVAASLIEAKGHYLVLDLDRIIEASPDRIESDCDYFPLCGSCRLRHLSYAAELNFKEQGVRDQLSHKGLLESGSPVFKSIMSMEHPFHYRGKSIFPIAVSDSGENDLQIGQYSYGSHDLIDLHHCEIQSEVALILVNRVRELASRDRVTAYMEERQEGTLRHLLVRTAFSTRQVMLVCVVNDRKADPAILSWIPDLRASLHPSEFTLQSVWINDMEAMGNRILSSDYRHLDGSETIEEVINQVAYRISPDSFFQVNPRQAAVLFEEVIRAARLSPGERVLDLYSGVGALSLQLASAMKDATPPLEVTGVDRVTQAVMDARINAKINGLQNLTFIEADATAWLEAYEESPHNRPFDVIVVDPPRKGLEPQALDVIRQSGTHRIVYVSCNPATLARDLALLTDGYTVERVQPLDLFPRTTHVETVVLMSRVESK